MTTGAIAIFVKTIGYSPVKTRLAHGIGRAAAETFHRLAAQAVAAVVQQATDSQGLTPYWAVAEPDAVADPAWQRFGRIVQGQGELGTRLDRVYNKLLQDHRFVLLLGADSPQIDANCLIQAATWADQDQFVLGLAADGGFYLFGGARAVPRSVWESVPYSDAQTASRLMQAIAPLGEIQQFPILLDVDTVQDLQQLQTTLTNLARREPELLAGLLPEQCRLLKWINNLFAES